MNSRARPPPDHRPYLLALAVAHGGRLVTFDQAIALPSVHGATADHLLLL